MRRTIPRISIFFASLALSPPGFGDDRVDALIRDLRADDVRWNAIHAMDALGRLPEPPIAQLHAALDSEDWQQRQLACDTLWFFLHPPEWWSGIAGYPEWRDRPQGSVTRRLLEVTVEGLRDDGLPRGDDKSYTYAFNASLGFRMLVLHAAEARELLERGLSSDDYQQKFLCALALGFGKVEASAALAAPVLLPHLRDNNINEDAKWCVHALYGFGDEVLPLLEVALPEADAQQRDLLHLLILDITAPPTTRAELEARKPLNSVSGCVFDPAVEEPGDDSMSWLRAIRNPVPITDH